ncbi:MAG: transposase [Bacteroidetes bacterium]|nr:transposase [Bacteroidota bacterium]
MHRFASKRTTKDQRLIYLYRTTSCKECPVRSACTPSKRGRYINRWEHEHVLDNLKQRKEIIEHVFGTIKKIWGYGALLLSGIHNVLSEFALMMITYNMRRAINIVGVGSLIQYLHTT